MKDVASMFRSSIQPQNLPERLVWYYIISTYLIYFLGAQIVFAQLLALCLIAHLVYQWWYQTEETPSHEKISISFTVWVWIIVVLILEAAVLVSHANYDMDIKRVIETTVHWSRTWALFAFFPLVGHLNIRPQLIYRAICILCAQNIVMICIGYVAGVLGLPKIMYSSPLGSLPLNGGTVAYMVDVFQSFPAERLYLFAPWPPALGLTGCIYFFLVREEKDQKWRWIGLISVVLMVIGSVSRAAMVCLPATALLVWALSNISRASVHFMGAAGSFVLAIFGHNIVHFLESSMEELKKARSHSSSTRDILERVALYRWRTEAPIWGHGLSEPGPPFVARMPIGTHHTWFGLLFTHGLVGCTAFAIGLIWTFFDLCIKAQSNEYARVALGIVLTIMIYSFSEHMDGSVYVFWPGLLMVGIGLRQSRRDGAWNP